VHVFQDYGPRSSVPLLFPEKDLTVKVLGGSFEYMLKKVGEPLSWRKNILWLIKKGHRETDAL
jgi:hypothetical protein